MLEGKGLNLFDQSNNVRWKLYGYQEEDDRFK
jgi:hypothetical protein